MTRPIRIELTATDVPGLSKTKQRKHLVIMHISNEQKDVLCFYRVSIPITHESPFLYVQCIHSNVKENKSLSEKRQSCKGMPVSSHMHKRLVLKIENVGNPVCLQVKDGEYVDYITWQLFLSSQLHCARCNGTSQSHRKIQ